MNASKKSQSVDAAVEKAAAMLANADALMMAAGAGMGVDSGLPDFRGVEGFWRAYPALRSAGLEFSQIASPHAFHTHPLRAWGFYGHRLALYRATQPHPGFEILKQWGESKSLGMRVFTSNVDGQFQKAGVDPDTVYECHGSIHFLQCLKGCSEAIWSAGGFVPQVDEAHCLLLNSPPRCPACGGLARPNILMFGDGEWVESRAQGQVISQRNWLERVNNLVIVEMGAGLAIPTVRRFSEYWVSRGASLIRINPQDHDIPQARAVSLPMGALAGLRAIQASMEMPKA